MKIKTCFYPDSLSKKERYCVRFQTDFNDNNVNCWMNGFPLNKKPLNEATLPLEKAAKYWYDSAKGIRRIFNPDCFDGSGILSLVSYPEAVKIDAELRKLADNGNT
jgi:hypothetical protein